jgi:two-component system response regulator HydG
MAAKQPENFEILTLEEVERRHVLKVLRACNGSRTEAAKILGIDRKTLARKLARWSPEDV